MSEDLTPLTNVICGESGRIRLRLVKVLAENQLMIQGYAFAIVRDHHLAEDVYQEVAAIVATRGERLPDDAGLGPWLREITRRKSLELRRRSRRVGLLLSDEVIDQMAPVFDEAPVDEVGDLRGAMASCVEKLPDEARAVITGRYGEDLSCEQLAEQVGRSVQGVYSMLKRLRVSLARCVQQRLGRPVESL